MLMNATPTEENVSPALSPSRLWLIVVGPAVVWLGQFQIIYTLVAWACATHRPWVIPLTSAISVVIAAGLGAWAWKTWREIRVSAQAEEGLCHRFMASLGLMMAG